MHTQKPQPVLHPAHTSVRVRVLAGTGQHVGGMVQYLLSAYIYMQLKKTDIT